MQYSFEEDNVIRLNDKLYQIVPSDQTIFDEEFRFLPAYVEDRVVLEDGLEGWFYEFGGRFYVLDKEDVEDVELIEARYLGSAKQKLPTKAFLGIHSGFELMNGIGLYEQWIAKAKFLGIQSLGICEKNTLSGVMAFQKECLNNEIKPVIGMSVSVKDKFENFLIKLYVRNRVGWLNVLKFNQKFNVENNLSISLDFLLENLEGLVVVLDPKTMNFELTSHFTQLSNPLYYQLDTVEFMVPEKDKLYIDNLELFLKSDLKPISITDAYYLEKDDWSVREILWSINKAFDDKTSNQYFKNKDQYAKELIAMFEESNTSWISLFKSAVANEQELIDLCNFNYDTSSRRLPRYEMSATEKSEYATKEDLFLGLIKKGFKEREINDPQKYVDRLKEEMRVLKRGGVLDYFLILHDIISYARQSGKLVGVGRGSAGGSLVSYLLGLIQIDPLEFDLLFERFLNDGRMGTMQECDSYEIETDEGPLKLVEGSLLRISRNNQELVVYVHELAEGDIILKY